MAFLSKKDYHAFSTPFDEPEDRDRQRIFLQKYCEETSKAFNGSLPPALFDVVNPFKRFLKEHEASLSLSSRPTFFPLLQETDALLWVGQDRSCSIFYTSFPLGDSVNWCAKNAAPGEASDWRTALKAELLKCSLQTVFLYGSNTPVCAYAVIGLINTKNHPITPFGVGKLIGNRFRVGREQATFRFTPVVLIQDPAVLAIALAHVGTQRVSHYPTKDYFDTRNGDVGDKRAAWMVEQVRVTSLARQIRQRAQTMARPDKAQSLRDHYQAMAAMYGVSIPYDAQGPDLGWSNTGSFVTNVSCLLQVSSPLILLLADWRADAIHTGVLTLYIGGR